MIILYQSTHNKVIRFLNGSRPYPGGYLIWELIGSSAPNNRIVFSSPDNSYSAYFNSFTFSCIQPTGTVGLTAGIVKIPTGEYNYAIYDTTEWNVFNDLNVASASYVEGGLIQVYGTYSTTHSYASYTNSNIYYTTK